MHGDDQRPGVDTYLVRGSHRGLVHALPDEAAVRPAHHGAGLVVVPLARRDPEVRAAAGIAQALRWPLLLLCSHGNDARRARGAVLRQWPALNVVAADLLHGDMLHAHRGWTTPEHRAARERRDVDTNRKRNLGLAAARMTGRSFVLFVDDDIVRLSPENVAAALDDMAGTGDTVAGWPVGDFPDNSVVHHARRDFLELDQDVFLGGGALLVRLDAGEPSGFPPVYNEDWLFLFEPIARGRVAIGPSVGQLGYDPYDPPDRARAEEFGDILGEGLYHLLHERADLELARHPPYWQSVHAKRTKLLHKITKELRGRLSDPDVHDVRPFKQALAAIDASRHELTRATPEMLADFVRRWRLDEDLWREFFGKLPERETLKEALVYLGLHEAWVVQAAG